MGTRAASAAPRPYHHGDLRTALIDEGVALARAGGPAAVQLRDAARRVGVSHNAGYRHFADRDDYLDAVAVCGMTALADSMRAALAAIPAGLDLETTAKKRLSAVGESYVRFALAEPGLFTTAFSTHGSPTEAAMMPAEASGPNPYQILIGALDELAAVGLLPAERRGHSEIVAWAAVHGLAELLIDGPLRGSSEADVDAMWARLNDAILRGL